MIETIKGIIDIIMIQINGLFDLKIDFVSGKYVSLGVVVLAFVFVVLALYFVFKALGLKGDD